jgi:hypothetical protein
VSHRPIHKKKLRRLRKAISRRPLPTYIDLIDWLKLRGYATTTGQAVKLLLDGKVRSDSHVIGRERISASEAERWAVVQRVPASLRDSIRVVK